MKAVVAQANFRQAVERGRRNRTAERARMAEARIVGHDDHDVGAPCGAPIGSGNDGCDS